ncbi:MAG: S41 family peptidase [Bacteroidetes bacterium]|jgi:carboxyl-terminal processing protease|nr:S41 family peptidase [Bacteroidota bacterium]
MKKTLILLLLLLTVIGNSIYAQNMEIQKLGGLMQMIDYYYVDTVNKSKLVDDGIRAILKDCDPHSMYIPANELKEMNEPLVGKFEGVGIQFNILDDTIMVTQTIAGGPSEKLGIRPGDRIVNIDGNKVAGVKITNKDVISKLRGDKGTKVKVDIYRRGEPELLAFDITRDKIPLFSIDASYKIEPDIGYIKISRFADSTVDEFKEALAKLKKQGIKSLILDLTNNGGGYLNRAHQLADEFLSDGKLIVYTQGRSQPREDYYSTATGGWEKGKLVVMINEYSASASEIVTGAIQDWDRGLVVGRRSFGKGLVQKPYTFPDGSAVRLTVARYYTPSGRCIQKSYQEGDEQYSDDISNRFKHGELYHADSIKFNDSLKYFTNGKRIVYGGGGIMPDVFVPLDTTFSTKYYSDLIRKAVMSDFSLTYADNNRAKLKSAYADVVSFNKGFNVDDAWLEEFYAFADKKGVAKDEEALKRSKELIKAQLKALIARDLYDMSAYFYIINNEDNTFKKAVESIKDNTFDKNKIAVK